MKFEQYRKFLVMGSPVGRFTMTQGEYKEQVDSWHKFAERNQLSLSNGKPIPLRFYSYLTGCGRRTHEQMYHAKYHTKGNVWPNKPIPDAISLGVYHLSLLTDDQLLADIKLNLVQYEVDYKPVLKV